MKSHLINISFPAPLQHEGLTTVESCSIKPLDPQYHRGKNNELKTTLSKDSGARVPQ